MNESPFCVTVCKCELVLRVSVPLDYSRFIAYDDYDDEDDDAVIMTTKYPSIEGLFLIVHLLQVKYYCSFGTLKA